MKKASAVRYGPTAYADVLGVMWDKPPMTRNAIAEAMRGHASRLRFTIARMHAVGLLHISGEFRGYPLFKVGSGVDKFACGTTVDAGRHAPRFKHLWDTLSEHGPLSRHGLADIANVPRDSACCFISACIEAKIVHVAARDRGTNSRGIHIEHFEIGRKPDAPKIRPVSTAESTRKYLARKRGLEHQAAITAALVLRGAA